jgi:EmrB/QacA subfamily drug resistance transporter
MTGADSGQPEPENARPEDTDEHEALRSAKRVLTATSLGVLLSSANSSTLDVALPVVARHFRAGASAASWALLSYLLVYTALLLVFGRLADLVGRRRLYLLGLVTLTLASLACGFAPNMVVLDVLRGIQAVGAAAIITNVTALLTDAFPPAFLALGLGLNVTVGGVAQVGGPLIGGFLASELGWRAVFLFNVPTGLIALIWSRRVVPPGGKPSSREPLDLVSSVVCMGMLAGVMAAVSEAGILGWRNPLVIGGAILALVAAPTFVLLQYRRRYPLVHPDLFRDRDRAMAYVSSFLLTGVRYSIVLLVALYLQAVRGQDAFAAGLHVIPVAVGMMIASPVAGRLAGTFGAKVLATSGLGLSGVGLVGVFLTLGPSSSYGPLLPALLCIGLGVGIFMTPNTSSIMASVTKDRRGIANGVRQLSQQSGAALSAAVCLAVIASPLTPVNRQAAYAGELSLVSGPAVREFTGAYHLAFAILLGAVVIAVAVSLLRSPPPTKGPGREPRMEGSKAR